MRKTEGSNITSSKTDFYSLIPALRILNSFVKTDNSYFVKKSG